MTAPSSAAPTGEVTFFFTDVEGSTSLWERDPGGMEAALAEHDQRLRGAIAAANGYIFTTAGDSFAAAFPSAEQALNAALEAQLALREPCADILIKVRMGLHTGTATGRDGDYFGAVVNRCARLMSAAHGGQLVVSGFTTTQLVGALPESVEFLDLGEHRLKDLLRPEHIFQVCHPDLERRFEPLRTLNGPASNLPVQLTSFVGRDLELSQTQQLLDNHRFVTLTGSGGAGKTRLALQLAAEAAEGFPDGVRLVELAAITDPPLVYDAIATSIGVQAAPDVALVDTLAAGIGTKRMLLVTDNCEHVLEAIHHATSHLLQHCPNLKVVATSRERIGGLGEAAFAVPSLGMPIASGLEAAQDVGAVQLFAERAVLAKPDFRLTDDNVDAVVSICRQLDGIPLAIELAAARLRVLSPRQIADRLDERFALLGSSDRGTTARHRTLAATIAWSYDHLTDAEQAVFRRAGVFAGNFTFEAVEAVCVGGVVDRWDVLDVVSGLVDKSMLVPEDASDGETRYRLLESMRVYGQSLQTDDETTEVAAAHADYYRAFSEELRNAHRSGHLAEALRGLSADVDNIRAALRSTLDGGRHVETARIIAAIGYLWYTSGAFREGVEWCRELFDNEPDLPDEELAGALHSYSLVLGSWAQPEEGVEMLRRQVEIRERIGDPARLAAALNNLGNLLTDLGHTEEAEARLRAAIDEFRRAGEPATLALVSLNFLWRDLGIYEAGAELCLEALDEATRAGDPYGLALAQCALGEAHLHLGRVDDADAMIALSRIGFDDLGVAPGVAYNELLTARVARSRHDAAAAATSLLSALRDPDAHWYLTAKFWIIQLAAELSDDVGKAAELLGFVTDMYTAVEQAQPAWALEHLHATIAATREQLGDDEWTARSATGARIAPDLAIVTARQLLRAVEQPSVKETLSDLGGTT